MNNICEDCLKKDFCNQYEENKRQCDEHENGETLPGQMSLFGGSDE